jgi:hypothetical protein
MLLTVFGDLERLLADLYPYRFILTPVFALIPLTIVFLMARGGLIRLAWRHRFISTAVGVPLVVVSVVVANYLLSPIWQRSHLEEASPLAMMAAVPGAPAREVPQVAPSSTQTPSTPPVFEPRRTHAGMFKGADDFHFGRGDALLITSSPEKSVLRFEGFSVRNGPDLYVYLSTDTGVRRVDESLNLGRLKATDGAFNYDLPSGIDVASIKSVVVWCKQFGVLFAEAPLQPL